MRIEVITGPAMSGKSTKLRARFRRLVGNGYVPRFLVGTDLRTPEALVRAISEEIEKGQKNFLVDDCSRDQVKAVREWVKRHPAESAKAETVLMAEQA
jgi:bifunctional pyridoxal-dependent enzyme with beta-cystathionase and maltose regulon repressor activities